MNERIPVDRAQKFLAISWFAGFGVLFVFLVVLTITDRFGARTSDVWRWFWSALVPTLTLILGAFGYQMKHPKRAGSVDGFVYRLALALSTIYVAALGVAIFAAPLMHNLSLIETSPVWLQPLQGLLGLSLGAFFVSHRA